MSSTGKNGWKKWILLLILFGGVGAGGYWYYQRRDHEAPKYQTVEITSGEMTQTVTATGTINPVTNVQVGCQISGVITKLYADFNSAVKKGQLVAQIDPASYQADLDSSEGALANAQAALELAQVNAKRAQELFDQSLIPHSDYDSAVAALHQAEAMVKVQQASAEKARVNLAYCAIYSPVDGTVISRNVDIGQTVAASLNAPVLFQIANDLTKMQIDANVAEADVGGIVETQRVDFTVDAYPRRTFHGTVVQVRNSPIIVQNVVTYDTVIGVANPELILKPGMTANVSIIVAHRDDALRLPNAALRFHLPEAKSAHGGHSSGAGTENAHASETGGKSSGHKKGTPWMRTVYILGPDGNPKPVQVTTGITDGIYTEIVDGLKDGDEVITSLIVPTGGAEGSSNPFSSGRRF